MPTVLKPSGEKAIGSLSGRFRGAQGRLTVMYVAILACILLVSSSITYSAFSNRLERRFAHFPPRPGLGLPEGFVPPRAEEVRADLINTLLIVNGFLLLVAGVFSYWLAGLTLAPIQAAYDRQRRFLSDASHELRTPLAILQTDLDNERANQTISKETLARIDSQLEEVERMSTLVRDLLLLSRFDEDTAFLPTAEDDLQILIEATVSRLKPIAEQHHVSLNAHHPVDKTQAWLVPQELFTQAFGNVVKNAILYNKPDGEVDITYTRDHDHATIHVRDTGIGIAHEDLEHIFDRFYRVDSSRSRQTGGSGLGLAIVRSAVERMDGHMNIDSTPNVGTTITFTIPIKESRAG